MDLLADQLAELLACTYNRLSIKPCRKFINPGPSAAVDNCEVGYGPDGEEYNGQLWVAVTAQTPNWPNPTSNASPCPPQFTAVVEIGIARCTPTQDDEGNAPAEDDVTESALQQLQDRYEILQAIMCCWSVGEENVVYNQWVPQTPQGGCAVSTWEIKLRVGGCNCDGVTS